MPAEIQLSRRGFPLLLDLDETPKLRNLRLPDIYPRYGFGWIVPDDVLVRHAEENDKAHMYDDVLNYGLQVLQDAGLPECDFWHIRRNGVMTTLWFIATNESPEKRDLASNKEYVERAKAALGQTEDARWHHMDRF
ncbi:hypothetical protein C2E23DRAFT_471937 [Lenzites betulinus]|nr:hypothetical protein C2E23DRAFT_471937 [Lenzites betulinus]